MIIKKLKVENDVLIGYHSIVNKLIENDSISLENDSNISALSSQQLSILCKNIILNVVEFDEDKYLLIMPNLLYNRLREHPEAKNKYINVLIHSPESEQDFLVLIDTLNLVQPALSLLESAKKSKTINARYLQLNKMGHKATPLRFLAKLANKCPSTFRGQ